MQQSSGGFEGRAAKAIDLVFDCDSVDFRVQDEVCCVLKDGSLAVKGLKRFDIQESAGLVFGVLVYLPLAFLGRRKSDRRAM